MVRGVLIAESLQVGITLEGVRLVVQTISRSAPQNTTDVQPEVWTLIEFEAEDSEAPVLAERLATVLNEPGWYADFHSETETFVVFPHRVFRYSRNDEQGRMQAKAHGRSLGIPESQLDWPE